MEDSLESGGLSGSSVRLDVKRFKVVVIGDSGVGKTSFLMQCTKNKFPDKHIPTVSGKYETSILYESSKVELELIDTPGVEDYDEHRYLTYPGADIFFIMFSFDDPISLGEVKKKWYESIILHGDNGTPYFVIGNKVDLKSDLVSSADLKKIVKKISGHGSFETSSKTILGMDSILREAVRVVLFKQTNAEHFEKVWEERKVKLTKKLKKKKQKYEKSKGKRIFKRKKGLKLRRKKKKKKEEKTKKKEYRRTLKLKKKQQIEFRTKLKKFRQQFERQKILEEEEKKRKEKKNKGKKEQEEQEEKKVEIKGGIGGEIDLSNEFSDDDLQQSKPNIEIPEEKIEKFDTKEEDDVLEDNSQKIPLYGIPDIVEFITYTKENEMKKKKNKSDTTDLQVVLLQEKLKELKQDFLRKYEKSYLVLEEKLKQQLLGKKESTVSNQEENEGEEEKDDDDDMDYNFVSENSIIVTAKYESMNEKCLNSFSLMNKWVNNHIETEENYEILKQLVEETRKIKKKTYEYMKKYPVKFTFEFQNFTEHESIKLRREKMTKLVDELDLLVHVNEQIETSHREKKDENDDEQNYIQLIRDTKELLECCKKEIVVEFWDEMDQISSLMGSLSENFSRLSNHVVIKKDIKVNYFKDGKEIGKKAIAKIKRKIEEEISQEVYEDLIMKPVKEREEVIVITNKEEYDDDIDREPNLKIELRKALSRYMEEKDMLQMLLEISGYSWYLDLFNFN